METSVNVGKITLEISAKTIIPTKSGGMLSGATVSIHIPFSVNRYFYHGWQSWSLAAWLDAHEELIPPYPSILHSLQVDPLYALEKKPNGSWVGAVETPSGDILLLGALGLESHVVFDGITLQGFYEQGEGEWFFGYGPEKEVFNNYANLLGERYGKYRLPEAPKVWCSWYSLFTEINENILLRILSDVDALPFDVFQIDDGWQKKIGDWEANQKFPSGMQTLAAKIRSTGRKAGLWLAPFIVVPSSELFKKHPGWLLRDNKGKLVLAGVNWKEKVYALDSSHPDVINWLAELMHNVRDWGYDYVKLDFLYAGALPGCRLKDLPRETAYRQALQTIRLALGDAFLLTCGAPILPSLGLCDAIRMGPDVAEVWNLNLESRIFNNFSVPGTQNGIRTTLNRMWLDKLVHIDPDVVFFRSNHISLNIEEKSLLKNLALITNFKATSDLPSWLTKAEFQELKAFLELKPEIIHLGQYKYLIDNLALDYSEKIKMPAPLNWRERIGRYIIGNLANSAVVLILFNTFNNAQQRKSLRSELMADK
jgi:alpha-galactosidase